MTAPPLRPPPKPVRQVGVVRVVEDWLTNGGYDRLEAEVGEQKIHCYLAPSDLTQQIKVGQPIVFFNQASKHEHPFIRPAFNRVFMLVRQGRPAVVYVFRLYHNTAGLHAVPPHP